MNRFGYRLLRKSIILRTFQTPLVHVMLIVVYAHIMAQQVLNKLKRKTISSDQELETRPDLLTTCSFIDHGPVVQSMVILTSSLRRQLVKYMPTTLSNPLLLFLC